MYPWLRLIKTYALAKRLPDMEWSDTHVSHHICWPQDIDAWNELNNGRALTYFDLGRVGFTLRVNVASVLRENKWGFAVAGSSVRYRRRVQLFDRLEMRTRITCWDARFLYFEQSVWKSDGQCANHAVIRAAVTSRNGIVPPETLIAALGRAIDQPPIPEWIERWSQSEDLRPWPPMSEQKAG